MRDLGTMDAAFSTANSLTSPWGGDMMACVDLGRITLTSAFGAVPIWLRHKSPAPLAETDRG